VSTLSALGTHSNELGRVPGEEKQAKIWLSHSSKWLSCLCQEALFFFPQVLLIRCSISSLSGLAGRVRGGLK